MAARLGAVKNNVQAYLTSVRHGPEFVARWVMRQGQIPANTLRDLQNVQINGQSGVEAVRQFLGPAVQNRLNLPDMRGNMQRTIDGVRSLGNIIGNKRLTIAAFIALVMVANRNGMLTQETFQNVYKTLKSWVAPETEVDVKVRELREKYAQMVNELEKERLRLLEKIREPGANDATLQALIPDQNMLMSGRAALIRLRPQINREIALLTGKLDHILKPQLSEDQQSDLPPDFDVESLTEEERIIMEDEQQVEQEADEPVTEPEPAPSAEQEGGSKSLMETDPLLFFLLNKDGKVEQKPKKPKKPKKNKKQKRIKNVGKRIKASVKKAPESVDELLQSDDSNIALLARERLLKGGKKREGLTTKRQEAWRNHVRQFAKEKGISYFQALKPASKTFKKK